MDDGERSYCGCCRNSWDGWPDSAPGGEWAHGVWKTVAMLLDAPLKRAFDRHLAEHQCTWAQSPMTPLADCRTAWDLFFLTAEGRHAVMIG